MKEGFDREIDSLLRRRARGTAESRPWGDGAGDGSQVAHLDADELGAFAEGALPPSARVAAASHLADCERCRGVVVGLARVAGVGAEAKPLAVAATAAAGPERTPAWRALLSSLFSPRAMRFAVPVLALSLVGVVSYVALRSKSGASLQTERTASPRQGTLQDATSAPAASNTGTADSDGGLLASQNANVAPPEAPAPVVQPSETRGHGGAERPVEAAADNKDAQPSGAAEAPAAAPPPPVSTATEGPAVLSKAAPAPKQAAIEEGEAARSDSRESAERREKSARSSEPVDEVAVSNNDAVQRNRAAQSRMNETQVQMPDGGTRNPKRAADNNAGGGFNAGNAAPQPKESERDRAGARSGVAGRSVAKRAERKADDDEDAPGRDGDTRTAAGHRFRREGNAWVDVNYKTSMPSTGVRRGTEAFRALVADVPEVGRVAEAIGGEVIVVVGGRAYRIR